MAFNKHTISAGPTISREKLKLLVVESLDVLPIPTRLGQLCYINTSSAGEYTADLYVAVNVEGSLNWVVAEVNFEYIDTSTGLNWDPLAQFYNPLAS